jgi:hypothetical protein
MSSPTIPVTHHMQTADEASDNRTTDPTEREATPDPETDPPRWGDGGHYGDRRPIGLPPRAGR